MSGRALIIGGSVGGLFAATLLRTIGWETLVFERTNGNLADRGTGIGTRDEMFAVMRRSGIAVHASIGIAVGSRICLDCDGSIAHELPIPAVTSSWARIYRRLRDALPAEGYRAGMPLARIEQEADAVTAILADGTRVRGDLLIGADGLHSTVRRSRAALCRLRRLARRSRRARPAARASGHDPASHGLLLLGKRPDALDSDAGRRRWGPCLSLRLVPAG